MIRTSIQAQTVIVANAPHRGTSTRPPAVPMKVDEYFLSALFTLDRCQPANEDRIVVGNDGYKTKSALPAGSRVPNNHRDPTHRGYASSSSPPSTQPRSASWNTMEKRHDAQRPEGDIR